MFKVQVIISAINVDHYAAVFLMQGTPFATWK